MFHGTIKMGNMAGLTADHHQVMDLFEEWISGHMETGVSRSAF